jgi:hypothetical protein
MAPIETHRSQHGGDCPGDMVLIVLADSAYFRCAECGQETAHRATVAEAAEDVVWGQVTTPATQNT